MSELLLKSQIGTLRQRVTPASAGWHYVGVCVHQLPANESLHWQEQGKELCVVIVTGTANVSVAQTNWQGVGGREDLFADQAPGAVYVPAGESVTIETLTACEVAICSAPGHGGSGGARLIDPTSMSQEVRGQGTNTRYVRNILPETEAADSLLVVEVVTPSGHWSSYPPHKHDRDACPEETLLEETYYHRLQPASGYVHQRVYTDDRSLDETLSAEDGDVVLVPRGYHPVGVPHGYTSYYLNVMAGPLREWHFYNDPAHEWMLQQ